MILFQKWQKEPNAFLLNYFRERNFKSLYEASAALEIAEAVLVVLMYSPLKFLSDRDMRIVAERFGFSLEDWLSNWRMGFDVVALERQYRSTSL